MLDIIFRIFFEDNKRNKNFPTNRRLVKRANIIGEKPTKKVSANEKDICFFKKCKGLNVKEREEYSQVMLISVRKMR